MVFFKDVTLNAGKQYLVILDDEEQSTEKGTRLIVYTPLIGKYAMSWPKIVNDLHAESWHAEVSSNRAHKIWSLHGSHHTHRRDSKPLSVLGRHIIEGEARWDDDIEFIGEFSYAKGYWEWTEDILGRCRYTLKAADIYDAVFASLFTYDRNNEVIKAFCEAWCPSTNTLFTSFGEMSISLWDIYTLVGLPIGGTLFDEVVPSAKELQGVDDAGCLYLSRSCRYLFHAYHLLQRNTDKSKTSLIPVDEWIRFWSKQAIRYTQPPPRIEKKMKNRSRSTYNPSGKLAQSKEWSNAESDVFKKLNIMGKAREETYLAAFLSCWLCIFVLPNHEVNLIRPSVFKMASMMAAGRKVSLAIPVLASIYRGLNGISGSSRPSQVRSSFPIHFLYGWLALYFRTHFPVGQGIRDPSLVIGQVANSPLMILYSGYGGARFFDPEEARKRIHRGDSIWTCNVLDKDNDLYLTDDGNVRGKRWNYFMAIRSNYLPWRRGDSFLIEPYSPHRFSRQFGYYQILPGVLRKEAQEITLDKGLLYWRICVLSKTFSTAYFPQVLPNAKRLASSDYMKWWGQAHGDYFEENILSLISMKPDDAQSKVKLVDSKKRKDSLSVVEESSNNSDRHWKRRKVSADPSNSVKDDIEVDAQSKENKVV